MNDIRRLQHAIIDAFPDAYTTLSAPGPDGDFWSMRARRNENSLAATWTEGYGFSFAFHRDSRTLATDTVMSLFGAKGRAIGFLGCRTVSDEEFREAIARVFSVHREVFRRLAE